MMVNTVSVENGHRSFQKVLKTLNNDLMLKTYAKRIIFDLII